MIAPGSYAHAGFVQSLEFWKIEVKLGKNGKSLEFPFLS